MVSSPFVSSLFLFGGNTLQEVNCFTPSLPPPTSAKEREGGKKKKKRKAGGRGGGRAEDGGRYLLWGKDGYSNSENSLKSLQLEKGNNNSVAGSAEFRMNNC